MPQISCYGVQIKSCRKLQCYKLKITQPPIAFPHVQMNHKPGLHYATIWFPCDCCVTITSPSCPLK